MKYIFTTIIALLLFTTGIDAQEKESKWRMGFNYSLEENKSSNYLPANSSGFPIGYGASYDKPNYRFGVNISYQLREKLTLNSALNYSNKDFTAFVGCLNCTTVAPFSDDFLLRFIEIPLTLRQELFSTKLRPFIEFGINNFFPLHKERNSYVFNRVQRQNGHGLGMLFGGGFEYNLSKDFAFQFNIDYKTGYSNLYKDSDFKLKPLGYGIGFKTRL